MIDSKYFRWIAALAVVAGISWAIIKAHEIGADSVRLETARAALVQIERAQEQTQKMKDVAHDAQEKYESAKSEIADFDRRIRGTDDRMRQQAPSPEQLAQHTPAAIGDYAAETERDFAECRSALSDMGRAAAGAAAAAWAYRDAWPVIDQ